MTSNFFVKWLVAALPEDKIKADLLVIKLVAEDRNDDGENANVETGA